MTSETTKARLIEKHRDINVDGDSWWDYVYANWRSKLLSLGIYVDESGINFSGFWSQGDGASFTGWIDLEVFLEKHPDIGGREERIVAKVPDAVSVRLRRGPSPYSHEYTVSIDLDLVGADEMGFDSEVKAAVFEANRAIVAEQVRICDFEADILDQCRDYMRQLYRDLEAEHEHLTSDEAVWETIEANYLDEYEEDDDAGDDQETDAAA